MVKIRLKRSGSTHRPFYHISVADSRAPRDGRFIERIGYFNPRAKGGEQRLNIDLERVEYWLSVGAQPSERISSLIAEQKRAEATQ